MVGRGVPAEPSKGDRLTRRVRPTLRIKVRRARFYALCVKLNPSDGTIQKSDPAALQEVAELHLEGLHVFRTGPVIRLARIERQAAELVEHP